MVGTATLLGGHVAITARHVVDYVIRTYGAKQTTNPNTGIDNFEMNFELKLYQVLPGPSYRVWRVYQLWACAETDIALLNSGLDRTSCPDEKIIWRAPRLRFLAPPIGETVVAFGYREMKINVTEGDDGAPHIELNDRPTTSIGMIRQVYPSGRDAVLLPFPCFEIEARFDPGMSGGMVLDETGRLCGLICASLQHSDPDAPPIEGDDLHELDPTHFPGKQLTSRRPGGRTGR